MSDRRLHTPGPWSVEEPMDFELSIVEESKPVHEWQFIACIPHGGKKEGDFPKVIAEANARLIAAAPDLLALARRYAGECAECGGSGEEIVDDDKAVPCDACEDIRAVIDKAEGRS